MLERKYEYGIVVLKEKNSYRKCKTGIFTDEQISLLAIAINGCDYEYIQNVIKGLGEVISGSTNEFEWGGGERSWCVSENKTTMVTDNFEWKPNFEISTEEIYDLMIQRKSFMEDWLPDAISKEVESAFNLVKMKKDNYVEDKESGLYRVTNEKNGLVIKMTLMESDWLLTSEQYVKSLSFDKRYFPT